MSVEIVHSIAETAQAAAVEACWRQWRVLGFPGIAMSSEPPVSIIDPEALVLLSLTNAPYERRLEDALVWWAEAGATFLSVQRIRSLARTFPPASRDALGAFAEAASGAGDRRWRRYAGTSRLAVGRRSRGPTKPTLSSPPALMLRLRAGFGVGVKTDLLVYLIGCGGVGATIKEAKEATAYTSPALRAAAGEMALAKLTRVITGRPVRYVAQVAPWEVLLGNVGDRPKQTSSSELPPWRDWAQFFVFVAYVLDWAAQEGLSAHVRSSRARDLVLPRQSLFMRYQIDIPDPKQYKGKDHLDGLSTVVERVTAWMTNHL